MGRPMCSLEMIRLCVLQPKDLNCLSSHPKAPRYSRWLAKSSPRWFGLRRLAVFSWRENPVQLDYKPMTVIQCHAAAARLEEQYVQALAQEAGLLLTTSISSSLSFSS